jgi:hypothetical protein
MTSSAISPGRPIKPAMAPSAIMLGRPRAIALAIACIGSSTTRAPRTATTSGTSPCSGSARTRLASESGSSPAKRSMLCQSTATRMSNTSPGASTGSRAKRSKAAASPPRICGPAERANKP